MKAFIISLFGLLLISSPVLANELDDVKKLVEDNIVIVVDTIRQKDLDKNARNRKIIDTVSPFFDFETMAKISLGKNGWTPMSPSQQKEFIDLFVVRLQESFVEKLELYTDEVVKVAEAKKEGNRIHVVTHLISGNDSMELIFKFYQSKNGWLVYDIDILGVSVVQTYRTQFAGLLQNGDVADLIENLRTTKAISITGPAN